MPRTTDARLRTLETAANLFRRQGYHGTPVSQILEESGAPRGSLYFHFPGGKEQIASEAATLAATEIDDLISLARARSGTAKEFVGRLVGMMARWLDNSDFTQGCPIATVTLELVPAVDEVAVAVQTAYQRWTKEIEEGLVSFSYPETEAEAFANLTLTAIEGGLLVSRAYRSTAALRQVREQLMKLAEAATGPQEAASASS
jgi:TetR/AcrR family transcriptional repressor of lmrAB and yxaGH operons